MEFCPPKNIMHYTDERTDEKSNDWREKVKKESYSILPQMFKLLLVLVKKWVLSNIKFILGLVLPATACHERSVM